MAWFSYHGGHSGEFCRHAKGNLHDVVERAVALGFTTYGLSEHCPRYRNEDLFPEEADLGVSGLQAAFDDYFRSARALQLEYADRLSLLVGFETEALPDARALQSMHQLRERYRPDFIIGSVHSVRGRFIDYTAALTEQVTLECGGWPQLAKEYFEEVASLVSALKPEVVGHLDLVRRFRGHDVEFPLEVWPTIETALAAVKDAGSLLEVNSAPMRRGFGPVYPGASILKRARELGIPVTLGDDSHGPHDVGAGLDDCMQAIEHAGYQEVYALERRKNGVAPVAYAVEQVRPRAS